MSTRAPSDRRILSTREGPGIPPMAAHPNLGCATVAPEAFWPRVYDEASSAQAKAACAACPIRIRKQCLNWAIKHEPDGYWGGKTPHERSGLKGAQTRAQRTGVAA